jgi:hypothetical protein
MTPAAIRSTFEDHQERSERINRSWRAIGGIDCQRPQHLQRLEDYFRVHIREPIMFQQTRVYPALLELEPKAAPLVREASAQHAAILASCGRLFVELAQCLSAQDDHAQSCCAADRGREILDGVIERMARSDRQLLPLLRANRAPLAERLWPAAAGAH